MITVSELALYPVKSCRQQLVQQHTVDSFGLAGDRRWMIITRDTGGFITQRTHPQLVSMSVAAGRKGITISAPGLGALNVDTPKGGDAVAATVWKDTCQALDGGDAAADWVSVLVGKPCRLVYMPDDYRRQVDTRYAEPGIHTGFADGFPFLLISESSLEQLNGRLADPVPMKRFRPNIVVSGCEPHAEDNWKRIRIGEIEFSLVKPCTRCAMTTVNTDTTKMSREPLATLASYRKTAGGITFGMNMIHRSHGMLATGMPVELLD